MPADEGTPRTADPASEGGDGFATPGSSPADYTDGRRPWDWKSKYPDDANGQIRREAFILAGLLFLTLVSAAACLGTAGTRDYNLTVLGAEIHISFRLLAIFFTGCLGGTTFSIKWLIHSVAKGKWHVDRRYWRFLVPAIGGVYACVVMTLFGAGLFATPSTVANSSLASTAALAFLVGYFSDGVSGLLSNVANAVFGTLEKK
jgi:hypothetical protein